MADKKKSSFSPPALGGASLLTVFAVLCLTVFALLSLSTVQAHHRLSDASAQAVSDYYAADCHAQGVLAALRGGQQAGSVRSAPYVPEGDDPPLYDTVYSFTSPISDTQVLEVEVALAADSPQYTILRWQARPAGDWDADDSLHLWNGGEP